MKRLVRVLGTLVAALASTIALSTAATPAQAAVIDALCPLGSDVTNFNPGIVLLEPRQTSVTFNAQTARVPRPLQE